VTPFFLMCFFMVPLYLVVVGNRASHDSLLVEKNLRLWVVVTE